GSMLLSAIMLKMGIYGMLRLLVPICPQAIQEYGIYAIGLAVFGLIYASIIAINRQEIKRLIAYSSLAHVGLIAAAVLTVSTASLTGAVLQMVAHGINVFGLFLIADIIFVRTKTTELANLGGIASAAPKFAIFFMIVMLGSVALPLTNGFVGEFLMLSGIFNYNAIIAAIAGVSVILGAVYMFRLYRITMFGDSKTEVFADLSGNEMAMASVVCLLILLTGIYPNLLTSYAEPAIKALLSKYAVI
ncbi:MAG TPA: NADH-quinone oxidoreductase subunit M, partial [Bacteroidales bacterium]|nr:NADH-quinone oxidoreductase subunit M [Bacteroidales bacterium]